jgi:hypothetical protein
MKSHFGTHTNPRRPRFQSLYQSLYVGVQIRRIRLGGDLVYATGGSLIERLPGVVDQLLIQASIEISKTVSFVGLCLNPYSTGTSIPQDETSFARREKILTKLPLR